MLACPVEGAWCLTGLEPEGRPPYPDALLEGGTGWSWQRVVHGRWAARQAAALQPPRPERSNSGDVVGGGEGRSPSNRTVADRIASRIRGPVVPVFCLGRPPGAQCR